jgi:hypothetical protein
MPHKATLKRFYLLGLLGLGLLLLLLSPLILANPKEPPAAALARANSAPFDILHPVESGQVADRLKTGEQRRLEAFYELAILNPARFQAEFPQPKTPAEQAGDKAIMAAMSNPQASWERARQQKSPEEQELEAFGLWAMTHPREAKQLLAPLKTEEELVKEELARQEITPPPNVDEAMEGE